MNDKNTRIITILILISLMLLSVCNVLQGCEIRKTRIELSKINEELNVEIEELNSDINKAQELASDTDAQIEELNENLNEMIDIEIKQYIDTQSETEESAGDVALSTQPTTTTYTYTQPTTTYTQSTDPGVLTATKGVNYNENGNKETYYNMNMDNIVERARSMGIEGEYWVRDDGVKMYGDYVIVAANLDTYPRGTTVETSLGTGLVLDTGGFAANNPTQFDIATNW